MTGPAERPTLTAAAPAARPLLEILRGGVARETIETRAKLSGWVAARNAGCRDVPVSDAIALAAVDGVLDLLRTWAAQEPKMEGMPLALHPREQISDECQRGDHGRCPDYESAASVGPLCRCPAHGGSRPEGSNGELCWGDLHRIGVRL